MAKIEKNEGEDIKSGSCDGSSVKRAGIPKAVFVVSSNCNSMVLSQPWQPTSN